MKRRKKPTNLTLSDGILARAHFVMRAQAFSSLSSYIEYLIREAYKAEKANPTAKVEVETDETDLPL